MHENHKNSFMEGLIHLIAESPEDLQKSESHPSFSTVFVQIVTLMNNPVR